MEPNNIDTSSVVRTALGNAHVPKNANVAPLDQQKFPEIKRETDANRLHERRKEIRGESAKNLETIRQKLDDISKSLTDDMKIRSKNLSFSIDEITNRMIVIVSDKESGKIIKQIPSETLIKASHSMEALKGILYDDKY